MLCIGCLESRVGRRLSRKDFADHPFNDTKRSRVFRSRRLLARLRSSK
jgi:hypothetical protein